MRQILVLGLLAAVCWWIYDSYFVPTAQAGGDPVGGVVDDSGAHRNGQVPGGPAAGGNTMQTSGFSELLGRGSPQQPTANAAADGAENAAPPATPAPAALDAAGQQALQELLARIQAREPAAVEQAWIALQSGRLLAGPSQQLLGALQGDALQPETTFAQLFARLGTHNTFLHVPTGRELGARAFEAAMKLPDPEAVAAGSRYLELCLRGHIRKHDADARAAVDRAYAQYRIRADRWLCDPQNVAGARSYTVKSGDSLNRIAGRFRREGVMVEEGTIAALNRIHNKNAIQVGQRLKVPVAPIRAIVEKRSFSLGLYVGDTLLRLYWVGLGANDKTPVTTFDVIAKQPRPQWTAPDGRVLPYGHQDNILGEYFIKFGHPSYIGFGAHGTPMPETIGTMSSMGCIRMYAPDIAELFEILPRGATVEIRANQST